MSGSKTGHGWLSGPIVRLSILILILVNCIAENARATDLDSSQTGYALTPAGNPYNVIAGADIDTTAQGTIGIYGGSIRPATWALINNGTVTGGYNSVEFDSPVVLVNNGSMISGTTTSIALFGGGDGPIPLAPRSWAGLMASTLIAQPVR